MRCEEVRELLPAYVDPGLHAAGEIDVHLASCVDCTEKLAGYRRMMAGLAGLRDRGEEPDPELLDRTLALIPPPSFVARLVGSAQTHPVITTVASIGGVAVGATAAALVWRARRRSAASAS